MSVHPSISNMSLVSVSVVRKHLGCSAQSIRRYISDGLLDGQKSNSGRDGY